MEQTAILRDITDLISSYQRYVEQEESDGQQDLTRFASWLLAQNSQETAHPHLEEIDQLIGVGFVFISNLFRNRMNRFVSDTPFSTFMDYQFLYVLHEHGKMTKAELIHLNYMEMSSGIEVIRRLLKSGWVCEYLNPEDRRSKRIDLTDSGRALVSSYEKSAGEFYGSFSRALSPRLKQSLSNLLTELLEQQSP